VNPALSRVEPAGRGTCAPRFERTAFLDEVRAALHPGAGALLTGPEGIGRSTALERLALDAVGRGARTLRTAPTPDESGAPYGALIDLLRPVPDRMLDDLPAPRRRALRTALLRSAPGAVDETGRERGSGSGSGAGPEAGQPQELAVAEAFAQLLGTLAAERPLLLVLDDVQHLDAPSAAALRHVARRAPALGVGLLGAFRTDPTASAALSGSSADAWADPAPGAARRDLSGAVPLPRRIRRFDVPRLSDAEIRGLVRTRRSDPALVRSIVALAAGNPGTALELADAAEAVPVPWPVGPPRRAAAQDAVRRAEEPDGSSTPSARSAPAHLAALPEPEALDLPGDVFGAAVEPVLPARLLARESAPVRRLPLPAADALLLLALSPGGQATVTELAAAGVADPLAALTAAQSAGLVRRDGAGRVRLRTALLGAALRQTAGAAQCALGHERLARAAGDPVVWGRHLAWARPLADEEAAEALDAAAGSARRRGDAVAAYELALLAAERTPSDRSASGHRRLLDAADHAVAAGWHAEARAAARSVLVGSDRPAQRVRARLLLLDTAGQALGEVDGLIAAGLAEAADDPGLQAQLYRWSAVRELLGGRTAPAARAAARAAGLAARAGDATLGARALGELATVLALRGRPRQADAALRRALRLEREAEHEAEQEARSAPLAGPGPGGASLQRRRALLALDADRVGQALRLLSALAGTELSGRHADAASGLEEQLATLVALVRVRVRAGECRRARENAARCAVLLDGAGVRSPLGAYALALAESAGGTAEHAVAAARTAVRGSAADGDRLFEVRSLGVLGEALLHQGGPDRIAAAIEVLQQARQMATAMELADPDSVRRLADLAEALAVSGETDEAAAVLAEAAAHAGRWSAGPRDVRADEVFGDSALAALRRAEALLLAASGRQEEAVAVLREAVDRLRELALPLDLIRTLVAWAAVERRARHRPAARAALEEAERLCARHGAGPLAERVRAEFERLLPSAPSGDGRESALTAAEQRLARLVADGATNREAAAALFVSVKTVEGTLSRVYRKLGVRSRTALARVVAAAE
jgi:DNA-binding CsgD family transcriptional regulator